MAVSRQWYDGVHMFMSELSSRVVAESGVPGDRFHLGKLILRSLRDAPDFVLQIDGATGESETFGSMLDRSVQCAECFAQRGVGYGDVIAIMAPNHLDVGVPFYAALYLGVIVAAVDRTLGVLELQGSFSVSRPKVIFCQSEKAPDVQLALNEIDLDAQIVTFDGGDYLHSFQEFMEAGAEMSTEDFKAAEFDPAEATAFLIATSGTTGLPKAAVATHKNFASSSPYLWVRHDQFPTPTRMALIGSPLQWLTALLNFVLSPILRYTRLQTSQPLTREHCYHLVNTYKLVTPTTEVFNVFGMSEINGVGFCNDDVERPWICGRPLGCLKYRIIDPGTGLDVTEPNVPGELWLKGPGIVRGYYNNPEATAETFSEDGWFKTGDMFYRDQHHYYVYVERIKLLLKYMSYQISPIEIEGVIRQHGSVLDVAVTGVPDEECGELPVACVVRREGCDVTAQDIKDLVKDSLSDAKQLRGGVVFLQEIPMTASTKVHRRKVKEIALTHPRE